MFSSTEYNGGLFADIIMFTLRDPHDRSLNTTPPILPVLYHTAYAYHVPIVGVAHKNWSMIISDKVAPVIETTLRTAGPVPVDSRQ